MHWIDNYGLQSKGHKKFTKKTVYKKVQCLGYIVRSWPWQGRENFELETKNDFHISMLVAFWMLAAQRWLMRCQRLQLIFLCYYFFVLLRFIFSGFVLLTYWIPIRLAAIVFDLWRSSALHRYFFVVIFFFHFNSVLKYVTCHGGR